MTRTSHVNAVGSSGEIAALLIESENNQSEAAHLERDSARAEFLMDAQAQVNELNDAASATMTAAFVSAAFSVAGGACEIGGAVYQFKADTNASKLDPKDFCGETIDVRQLVAEQAEAARIWNTVGKTASELTKPTTMIGQSIAEHDQASAKKWETAGARAQWQASDASTTIDKANKQSDALLEIYQGIQRDQNQSNNAIIGRI